MATSDHEKPATPNSGDLSIPKTAEHPSPWTVINEFLKTVITLSSALFALAVTFFGTIFGKVSGPIELGALFLCWLGLAASIILAVVAHGLLVNYLRQGTHENATVLCANSSFYALAGSAVLFLTFGGATIFRQGAMFDAVRIIENVRGHLPTISGIKDSTWSIERLDKDEKSKEYELIFAEDKSLQRFKIRAGTSDGMIVKIEKQ